MKYHHLHKGVNTGDDVAICYKKIGEFLCSNLWHNVSYLCTFVWLLDERWSTISIRYAGISKRI